MDTKFCAACQTILTLDQFSKNRSRKDGLQSYCKSCSSIRQKETLQRRPRVRTEEELERDRQRGRERYAANPEPYKQRAREWRQRYPDRKRENDRRWRANNKDKANEIARRWVKNNPEKRKEVIRRYDQANKDKSRINSARYRARKQALSSIRYTEQELLDKLLVWRYRCYLCNELLDDTLHWDHVKPLARGGADILCNLRPTHGLCNMKKNAKWPLERIKK